VIGVPDETRGTVVKAFIVLQPGQAPSAALEASLQDHVRKYLAPYEYPKIIEFIDALPMTTTGKVQRRLLRQRDETGQQIMTDPERDVDRRSNRTCARSSSRPTTC
jgi:acetyl-CoA synthetase